MILPGMGVISEVISTFSRKRVFGYTAVAFSSVAIAVFGFFVWAHHMFIMGVSNYSSRRRCSMPSASWGCLPSAA
jgi:cytochrome c oxidase subunit 1